MFLEFYKKLKKSFDEEELFETKSFGNNVLFGFEKKLNESFDNYLRSEDVLEFNSDLEKTVAKFQFIKGFLEYYKIILEDESKVLDLEVENINNTSSAKGSSFLDLKDRMLDFTKVLSPVTNHVKNIKKIGDVNYKVEESSEKCDSYMSFPTIESIVLNLRKPSMVNEIIFETHKPCTISIYGELKNGETKPLFLNVDSSQRLFANTLENEYTRLIILSDTDLKSYLKTFNAYTNVKSERYSNKYGYIFSTIDSKSCKNIIISSDTSSNMFMLSKNEFELAIKDIQDKEKDVIDKYLTEKNYVEKNSNVSFQTIIHEFYLVEMIDKNTNSVSEIKIFGKE
ncbi:MAG: hypothetical protein ACRC5F_06645 [Cetobacterium sp.]